MKGSLRQCDRRYVRFKLFLWLGFIVLCVTLACSSTNTASEVTIPPTLESSVSKAEQCPTQEEQAYFDSVNLAIEELTSAWGEVAPLLMETIAQPSLWSDPDWSQEYLDQLAELDAGAAVLRKLEGPESVKDVDRATLQADIVINSYTDYGRMLIGDPNNQQVIGAIIEAEELSQFWLAAVFIEMNKFCSE